MTADAVKRLLAFSQQLATLTSTAEILAAACREMMVLGGAARGFASCVLPQEAWEHGFHVETTAQDSRPVAPAARSALFALHRKLAATRGPIVVEYRDDTAPLFAGLQCDARALQALPIVHRTGRIWGQLVVPGTAIIVDRTSIIDEVARHTTLALESAQRLAFARRDQDRLLLLAEATDDALYEWNIDSRDYWWGGGIRKLLGSDAEPFEHTARWKIERIHPDDAERVRASFDEARFSKQMTWQAEYRFRRHDDTYCHVEDRGYFLRDAGGRAYRVIGSMRDVTAMKTLLAREQHAREQAETANRAKDEFLAMLGHELRNPLAPIVTGLELMRLRARADQLGEIEVMQRQAGHLVRLVDDLLDISRIAHGKIVLARERIALAAVVTAAIDTARPIIDARQHVLTVDVPDAGLEVVADRARLAQAISNVLVNAAKYTEPRGRITVSAARSGDSIAVRVRDTGIGIEETMLPHIFRMFVQERQALDRSQGGLGIGLSIVKSLVELHGGTVAAASAGRGQGTEVTLQIPAAPPMLDAEPRSAGHRTRVRRPGHRIMVVDDNVDAAELLAMLLEQLGNTTRVAYDADGALALVEEFAPDLAVLDIGLPVIDGYELARRLRAMPSAKAMRLVALTGYGQSSDKQRASQAGFDAHLVKPIAVDALAAVIDKLTTAAG